MIPIILSGGSGTRLWPVSRTSYPKQFVSFFKGQKNQSLFEQTLQRIEGLEKPWVITHESMKVLTEKALENFYNSKDQIIYEPVAMNTAPAIGLISKILTDQDKGQEVVCVLSSDHLIQDSKGFKRTLEQAKTKAQLGQLVIIGIQPTTPSTGFGYIECEHPSFEPTPVLSFKEKPDLKTAKRYVQSGRYLWNAGMFVFQPEAMLKWFKQFQLQTFEVLQELGDSSQLSSSELLVKLKTLYPRCEKQSIDYGIVEKLTHIECVKAQFDWSDIGSWDQLVKVTDPLQSQVALQQVEGVRNSYFSLTPTKNVSFIGVNDLILVQTDDAIVVVHKDKTQELKKLTENIALHQPQLLKDHTFEERPWGNFKILKEEDHFKSKVIQVNPGHQLSYQSHAKRAEHWIITRGIAEITLNDEVIVKKQGESIYIPQGAKHRIKNASQNIVEFVEVQVGTYFGEDDIVRYQDDYGRA
jgi:mannose-1-phosphate guanylyltransferase/mannose-1-phosphate guanylyltransferase/mannose-6-phosphate isomerase